MNRPKVQPAIKQPPVRWMIRRDMAEVLKIERRCFEHPWDEADFTRVLKQRNCIGMTIEVPRLAVIAGFIIYELHKNHLRLLDFAIAPHLQRQGYGRRLFRKICSKLVPDRRSRLYFEVRDNNLPAHLFFRSEGCRAMGLLRDFYENPDEDAISFVRDYRPGDEVFEP